MNNNILIAPSILSIDFSSLGEQIALFDRQDCDWIHCDVMDGNFVPNLTFGPDILRSIRRHTRKILDVHLMVTSCDAALEAFVHAGADSITFHLASTPCPATFLKKIKQLGKRAGISIEPGVSEQEIVPFLDSIDLVLLMAVTPGFGGQTYLPQTTEKIRKTKQMIQGRPIDISVDGGVTFGNAREIVEAGANVLVAGSTLCSGGPSSYGKNITSLRRAALSSD